MKKKIFSSAVLWTIGCLALYGINSAADESYVYIFKEQFYSLCLLSALMLTGTLTENTLISSAVALAGGVPLCLIFDYAYLFFPLVTLTVMHKASTDNSKNGGKLFLVSLVPFLTSIVLFIIRAIPYWEGGQKHFFSDATTISAVAKVFVLLLPVLMLILFIKSFDFTKEDKPDRHKRGKVKKEAKRNYSEKYNTFFLLSIPVLIATGVQSLVYSDKYVAFQLAFASILFLFFMYFSPDAVANGWGEKIKNLILK